MSRPTAASPASVRLPELALLYCAAIWGSTFYIVKDVLADVHPLALIGQRFTLAGLLLLVVLLALRRNPLAGWRYGAGLGAIIFVLYAAQTYGLLFTTASNSAFITGLFVIFIPPLAYLFSRSVPTRPQLGAVALALAGLYLLTGGLSALNPGDMLTLIAAATYAVHVLLTGRAMEQRLDPLALATQQLLTCGILSFAATLLLGAPLGSATVTGWYIVLFLALLPTLSAYLLQLVAQRRVDPLRTSLIFTMEPVFGALFAWTLGGEDPIPLRMLGGLLIVAAMLVADAGLWAAVTRSRSVAT